MVKKLLLPFLLLLSITSHAQKNYAFSFLLGPSMNWYKVQTPAVVSGVPSKHGISGVGFGAALRYEYQKGPYIGFGAELEFMHANAGIFRNYDINGIHQPFEDSLFTHTIGMNSINVPVFLKIRLFNGRYNVSYSYIHAGVGIEYVLGGNRKVIVSNPGLTSKYPQQSGSMQFDNNLGQYLVFGFGRVMLTRKYVFLGEVRYRAGLNQWKYNIYPENTTNEQDAFKQNSISIELGIRLRNYHKPGCHEF